MEVSFSHSLSDLFSNPLFSFSFLLNKFWSESSIDMTIILNNHTDTIYAGQETRAVHPE